MRAPRVITGAIRLHGHEGLLHFGLARTDFAMGDDRRGKTRARASALGDDDTRNLYQARLQRIRPGAEWRKGCRLQRLRSANCGCRTAHDLATTARPALRSGVSDVPTPCRCPFLPASPVESEAGTEEAPCDEGG